MSNFDLVGGLATNAPASSPNSILGAAVEIDTCWQRIGVYGDGTCRELPGFVHCRNCPVYSRAGLQLLNRSLPSEYKREWTAHFAQEKNVRHPVRASAVLFRIGNEWFGLPTQAFQEVAERRVIHSLPHRRDGIVLGLANVRGELLVCVSLEALLGLAAPDGRELRPGSQERLLVTRWEGHRLAFPVKEVDGLCRFQTGELKPPPATVAKSKPTFTQGMLVRQQKTVGLLDAPLLFSALNRSLA